MSWVEVAAGCTLGLVTTAVEPSEHGWTETTEVELSAADADCDKVVFPLGPGVRDTAVRAVIRQGDGIKRLLKDQTTDRTERGLRGQASVVVWLPDMLSGDRAQVAITRAWHRDAGFTWAPAGARHAELTVAKGVSVTPAGRVQAGKRGWWVPEPTADDRATLSTRDRTGEPAPERATLLPPSTAPTISRGLTLLVPPGADPQLALYPGGGSRFETRLHLEFEAEDRDRAWWVPTGTDPRGLQVVVQPRSDAASVDERPDGWLVRIPASEGPADVTLVWTEADAPTHGEPAPGEALTVTAPDGKVVTEPHGAWFLAGIRDQAIIPARKALVRGLERRWRSAAIPEPGLPNELRGRAATPGTAAELPQSLADRVEVMDWGADPLFVRRLVKARKTGGLTPTEAAVFAWLYAEQARIDATWALVRPATEGPGGDASPAGFDAMLVRLDFGGGDVRWLDPACAACAPFEVRPELLGATALGEGIDRTPPPEPGRWTAVWGPDWVRWELTGPAALELRRWLGSLPIQDRFDALAARMAGPGAELVEAKGLDPDDASRPAELTQDGDAQRSWADTVVVSARGGSGVRADPLQLPPAAPDGSTWLDWPGVRERIVQEGDQSTVERLEIEARLLTADARLALQPPPPEPEPEDSEATDEAEAEAEGLPPEPASGSGTD